PPRGEIVERRVDGGALVVSLVIRKTGAEFVVEALRGREPRCFPQMALRRDLDELGGHFADATFPSRFAGLPGGAARPVELDRNFLRPVARQQFDVLNRQKQLIVAGIVNFKTIMRRAGRLNGSQADEAADTVIDMDHEVASRERRNLGSEVLGAL